MKAIRLPRYGSAQVLELRDVDQPTPKDNQVLIKVMAAATNPMDWHAMRGAPIIARMSGGWLKPKDQQLGGDVAGYVEAVGKDVTEFKPGDAVFGVCGGAFAEYVVARESKVALKPANVSFEAAAASPVVGFTALQGLRDKGQLQAGQHVLINGASGGIGMFAVQLAKSYGAEVTGVTSTRNLDLVRSIGADHVVDYTQEDFTRSAEKYELLYDTIGNRTVFDYARALTPRGRCVIAGFTSLPGMLTQMVLGPRVSRKGGKQVGFQGMAQTPKADLLVIRELLASGKVVPVIDRRYPLAETPAAIDYLEKGHARGKVIVTVGAA